jgi:hypothetical protein
MLNETCNVPDFSLGILSKYTIKKILNVFDDFNNIIDFFNINFKNIWLHQELFGFILFISNVKIYDTSDIYLNLFYETSTRNIIICNDITNLEIPLFIPLDMLYPNNYDTIINNCNNNLSSENYITFVTRFNYLNNYKIKFYN